MRRLLLIVVVGSLLGTANSCKEEKREYLSKAPPGELVPTMITDSVSTFISDSGYTRYHIIAPVWIMYEDAPDPYWLFPEGLHLEQYDEAMKPAADVRCDSARYFSRRRLWKLDGNVVMVNTLRDSFLTEQLFWDQTKQQVYSDSFIHIVRSDRVINGYGFESNQNMTAYTVNRPTGIIPVEKPEGGAGQTEPDSADAEAGTERRGNASHERASVRAARERELNEPPAVIPTPVRTQPRPGGPQPLPIKKKH